ncbi:MAG: orotidine-5'-phosphate decarboxylase [Oscillospiraceae bacterium]|nr:orotidine-5'-phosphate decarboxylase [Oscillospiraceae bacterium]
MSVDRLIERIRDFANPTVAGLDPRMEYLPEDLLKKHFDALGETPEAVAAAYLEFNKGILDALQDIVPAVKPQCAFYEALGPAGMETFRQTLLYAAELGYYVIADAKRGDIGSTARAYSEAFLGTLAIGSAAYTAFPCDALTVNPYLGSDNLKEFLKDCDEYGKMVFVLCKTSNPSSIDVQEMMAGHRPLYKVVAEQADRAGAKRRGAYGYSPVGVVAGATHPAQLRALREEFPHLFFLVPGYGAQGGDVFDILDAFDRHGRGAVINNSRGIICAWQKAKTGDYAAAARKAAAAMRDRIRKHVQFF